MTLLKEKENYRGPSFSTGNRVRRLVWGVTHAILFRNSPRPFHRWRAMLLRLFGAQLGVGCHVYPKVEIWAPWNLVLGDFVGIGDGVKLYSMDRITIGSYAVVSQGAHLCCGTHDYNSDNFQLVAKPIVIQPQVWICAEAFVHPGVVIADGSVIGARAVVTRSLLQPWAVYAGVPCIQVGLRTPRHLPAG